MKRFKFITLGFAAIFLATGCGKKEQNSRTATQVTVATSSPAADMPEDLPAQEPKATEQDAVNITNAPQTPSLNLKTLMDAVYNRKKSVFHISQKDAEAFMSSFGFTLEGTSNSIIKDDFGDMKVVKMSFKDGTETADVYVDRDDRGLRKIEFNFPDKKAAKEFVAASKKAMGKKLKSKIGFLVYLKDLEYWFIEEKGKKISIRVEEDVDGGGTY